jgi:choline/glycine/proline betaine transport protein
MRFTSDVNPYVFYISIIVIGFFLFSGVFFTETTGEIFDIIQDFIVTKFGWLYILAVAFFLVFVVFLFFSPYSSFKLGPDDSEPDYSYASWFAMLFSAGMGIGLVFFGVAEPMYHYLAPPTMDGESIAAAKESMKITFFHWGFHAWAIYIVVGLSLAYFSFRHNLPLSIRSAFYPLLGDRINGSIGNTVDILAIFGTMFGVATSLGIGVLQINAGLNFLFGIEISVTLQIVLITIITLIATVSVALGLDKGIKRLSNFNMILAISIISFVFLAGPSIFILNSMVENTGFYLQHLVETTFWLNSYEGAGWLGAWTLFYWGWWIAWSPFVGTFIARVSRGRTVREFIAGVLLAPTGFTFIWLTVFGNTALHMELFGGGGIAGGTTEQMLFLLLENLPIAEIMSVLSVFIIVSFFVTSSDSGSLVIGMLTSNGHPDPPLGQRIFWAVGEGAVAAVLLLAGGLAALQTAAITTGLPFAVVLLFMCYSLVKAMSRERAEMTTTRRYFTAKRSKQVDENGTQNEQTKE